jgi:tetratricopeptide (TPR) repeat protein
MRARPHDASLFLERGAVYRDSGDWDRARRDFGLAARLDPTGVDADLERAALELDAGRPASALDAADRALARREDSGKALRLRALALDVLGRSADAAREMEVALARLERPSPEDFLDRADFELRAGAPKSEILAGLAEGMQRLGPAVALVARAQEIDPGFAAAAASNTSAASAREAAPAVTSGASGRPGDSRSTASRSPADLRLRRGPYLQAGTPTSVVIRWRTNKPSASRVSFGAEFTGPWTHVDSDSLVLEHEIVLEGLEPATRYFYSVGAPDQTLAGSTLDFAFTTSPLPGSRGPTRIWVLGDSGTANKNARAVRDAFVAYSGGQTPDLWLMLGDNAYLSGSEAQYQKAVFEMYPHQLATSVLWPTRGNHEKLRDGPSNDYYDLFTMPTRAEAGGRPSGTEAYYSFDYANIHFICLDSEGSIRRPEGAMLTWLAADLASATQEWLIAFWHHPPYSKGSHDSDDVKDSGRRLVDMREFALPILEAGGVDLVMTGHSHSYERSMLLHGHYGLSQTLVESMRVDSGDGSEDGGGAYDSERGTVYAVCGCSGKTSGGSLDHPVMITSMNTLGSMVLDVHGGRLDAVFLDSKGVVRDRFSLVKETS